MGHRIGIVGATGVTGEVTLRILRERRFPVDELRLFASSRSAGRMLSFGDEEIAVEATEGADVSGLDLIISATPSAIAREQLPALAAAGPVVIDQSSAFRADPDVPVVVPEINADEASRRPRNIISGPNCTTAVAVMAIAPLHTAVGVRAVISSSYQSISGAGRDGIAEFMDHSRKAADQLEALRGHDPLDLPVSEHFPHPLAFNLIPQCETFPEGADTSTEESKMGAEMRKILGADDLAVHATAVRVPVVVSHSMSLAISLEREITPDEARQIIGGFAGVRVVDRPDAGEYPTPIDAAGIDEILVGRIRTNEVLPNGLSLFASGDNLRKGNALNAVQVAELVLS